MTATHNGWRGPSRIGSNADHLAHRARRLGARPMALAAGECAEYRRPHWSIHLIGPALVLAGLAIVVVGIAGR